MEVMLGTKDSTAAPKSWSTQIKHADNCADQCGSVDDQGCAIDESELSLLEQWCGDLIATLHKKGGLN